LGCSCGLSVICCRKSGEALIRNQFSPSALTATDACVARISGWSLRAAAQLAQPQFHCGTPPPAAAPNTTILSMTGNRDGRCAYFRVAQKYMLISMLTGTSTMRGLLQAMMITSKNGAIAAGAKLRTGAEHALYGCHRGLRWNGARGSPTAPSSAAGRGRAASATGRAGRSPPPPPAMRRAGRRKVRPAGIARAPALLCGASGH